MRLACISRLPAVGRAVPSAPSVVARERGVLRRARPASAFSLVELLVAVGLLAVIMVALMMAFQQVQRAMHLGLNQVDVLENGRAIMTLISRDLQEITFSEAEGATNFYVRPLTSPAHDFSPDFENAFDDLFFLVQTNNQFTSIKYSFVESAGVAAMYRKINPYTTNLLPVTNVYAVTTSNVFDNVNGDNAFARVADGIVMFRVVALDSNGQPYDPVTNTLNEVTIINNPALMPNVSPDYPYCSFANTNLPAYIDIEMGILEPQALKEFDAKMSVDPAMAKTYLTQRPGKVHLFRQRIPVRSHYRTDL